MCYDRAVKLITTRFRNGAEFLVRYEHSLKNGGVFIPTRNPLMSGESVILDIRMRELHDSLMVRGRVVWSRRSRRGSGQPAGMAVEFLPTEAKKRDYLLGLARGRDRQQRGGRRHKRLPLGADGGWRVLSEGENHSCVVGDIGSGGAFLHTERIVPAGTPVVVEVFMPNNTSSQSIEGRVAWARDTPGDRGIGVEFRCRDMAGRRRLRELVRRLQNALIDGPVASKSI